MTDPTHATAAEPIPHNAQDALPEDAWQQLDHWAQRHPQALALRHKRRGRWVAWPWAQVHRTASLLRTGLAHEGLGPQSRLAVCGAFEPRLLLLVLAARAAGAQVLSLPRGLGEAELAAWQARTRPTHVYLQSRDELLRWLRLRGPQSEGAVQLISPQPVPKGQDAAAWLHLRDLLGEVPPQVQRHAWHRAQRTAAAWCEEGTEWSEGLALVVGHWLRTGEGLAFPEDTAAAARDRRDTVPSRLLLSAQRAQQLSDEIEQRLPVAGSWRRRWVEGALSASSVSGGSRWDRWLRVQLQRRLGLHRLQGIVVPSSAAAELPERLRSVVGAA
ncbi:AMP-binding protein [Ideonella sp. B508-1]|uniref:AMP-binding protein n=1 Tax=Ideonella sp. B508-1 TaxID=137716 RepID=UPI0003461A95|nr:AMP-binding protein [Ideonella sp. B508-1]